jgi:murein DD-endopeptidase
MLRVAAFVLTGLLLQGCAGSVIDTPALRETITITALAQVGKPYRYGGSSPAGFDCSGLVQYVFAQAGVQLPRSTRDQRDAGDDLDFEDARPGDLLFYKIDRWFGVDHVAIYIGDGYAVHAPAAGRAVVITDMRTAFWEDHFVEGLDVLP